MSEQDQERNLLLGQLMTGALRPGEPACDRALERYPDLLERFRSLKDLEECMQAAADEEQGLLEEALNMDPLPEEDRFAQGLEEQLLRATAPPSIWRRLSLPLGAAAALLLATMVIRRAGPGDEPLHPTNPHQPGTHVLGESSGQSPRGAVSAYTVFRWELERPIDGTFTLEVFDATALDKPLIVIDHLEQNQWTYSAGEEAGLPDRILWRVFAMQGGIPSGARFQSEAWLEAGD